mmetsp:Transcript_29349/g.61299  ORF Transcript_29349/g.61299 Transcript_29349/m.61299 type:complete len:171 (-) Transcript_29349:1-513(-)
MAVTTAGAAWRRTSCEAPGAVAEPDGGAWLPPIRRAVQCLISERVRAVSSFGEGAVQCLVSEMAKSSAFASTFFCRGRSKRAIEISSFRKEATQVTSTSPLPKDLTVWNVADVRAWLSEIEMSHVSPQFVENSIDGAMLATLTDEDLQGLLGLSVLQTRKVRRELANLNQ